MKQDASDILDQAARTFEERHKEYGDNYMKVGQVMKDLFPAGIALNSVDDHNRFHIFMLIIVKITRYSENWGKGGHADSMLDIATYAAMLNSVDGLINRDDDIPF